MCAACTTHDVAQRPEMPMRQHHGLPSHNNKCNNNIIIITIIKNNDNINNSNSSNDSSNHDNTDNPPSGKFREPVVVDIFLRNVSGSFAENCGELRRFAETVKLPPVE